MSICIFFLEEQMMKLLKLFSIFATSLSIFTAASAGVNYSHASSNTKNDVLPGDGYVAFYNFTGDYMTVGYHFDSIPYTQYIVVNPATVQNGQIVPQYVVFTMAQSDFYTYLDSVVGNGSTYESGGKFASGMSLALYAGAKHLVPLK